VEPAGIVNMESRRLSVKNVGDLNSVKHLYVKLIRIRNMMGTV
jgi:hypothetical protein